MPEQSNNPFKFWEELKRRKVVRVSIAYLASAYVLLELISIIADPFGLPEWTLRFVFILLGIGFVITVLLSWIYDFTSEGIKKTESIKDAESTETVTKPGKWKIKVSDVVIAVLLILVVILAYPKVFRSNSDVNLASMTLPVTFINELGEKETRQVFKEEYIHKILLFPFDPAAQDSTDLWLKYGILDGIWSELIQFPYIHVYGMVAEHLQEQINEARIKNYPYFLTGSYEFTDGLYTIHTRIHLTQNGNILKDRGYEGADLLTIFDSISVQTCIDLGVQEEIVDAYTDLPFKEHTTGNIEAYRYYIQGGYSDELRQGGSLYNYDQALQEDSTFALAALSYAHLCNYFQYSNYSARKYIDLAMRHRQRLPDYSNIFVQVDKYRIYGDLEKAIKLLELQCELHPYDFELLSQLIDIYSTASMTAKKVKAIKKLNELVPDYPDYQIMLARNYLVSNDITKGLKYTEERIKEHPDNTGLLFKKGQFLLQKGDIENAEKVFQKVLLLSPENEKVFSLIMDHINYLKSNTTKNINLRKFTGRYRTEHSEYYSDILFQSDQLLRDAPNMVGSIYYQLSDTSLVDFFGSVHNSLGSQHSQFIIDDRGKVIKFIDHQSNLNNPLIYWKQDSLILHALEIFETGSGQEALTAFRKAYTENPEHYYLANYIIHLEFVQSNDYIRSKTVLESSLGEYDETRIFMEKDKFFLNANSQYYQLLPLSEDQFMNPSQYFYTIQIVKEGNQISGLKAIFNNGNEIFLKRTSLSSGP